jgi:hypothetical protein
MGDTVLSSFSHILLTWSFFDFDTDLDGGLNHRELNEFQKKVGSAIFFHSQEEMIETFVDSDIPLTTTGCLSLEGFMHLNETSGAAVISGMIFLGFHI